MSKKILFIEDEPSLQKSIGTTLSQEGYEMVSALDGQEGVKHAKAELPDLILLDLILPRKDGFEVLREIKMDPATKSIPIIVLTNLEGPDHIERAMELGAQGYLVKANYSLEEVVEKVKSILDNPSL